jgi:folate-dependent phosphoribosylglycinamide formyltransferase PurN
MRVLLTAGFDRALHAVALAELARRAGHEIVGVIVVRGMQVARIRALWSKHGTRSLFDAAKRLAGVGHVDARDDAMEPFLSKHAIRERSLSEWCRAHGVPRAIVSDLNGELAANFARSARPERVLYAGGGILRSTFLEAVETRVLNAHSGPLPYVRGMNACEWSLLLGREPAVSIHWIDRGIDTGATVEVIPLRVDEGDTRDSLRGKCTVAGVEGLLRALDEVAAPLPKREGQTNASRQCFSLAPALRELLDARLSSHAQRTESRE